MMGASDRELIERTAGEIIARLLKCYLNESYSTKYSQDIMTARRDGVLELKNTLLRRIEEEEKAFEDEYLASGRALIHLEREGGEEIN